MSSNPFISKEVNLKRVGKGVAIFLPCLIMMLVVGTYYFNLIDSYLRSHYVGERQENVLGIEKSNFEIEYASELDDITKNYGIDEYIYKWDGKIDGFYNQNDYIREPEFYITGDTVKVSQTWVLKNGYKLELYCPPKELKDVIPGIYDFCSVKYNDTLLSDDVRYYISSPDEGKITQSIVNLVVYSPDSYEMVNDYEIVVVGSYAGGSYDNISVYKLENGVAVKTSFFYNEESGETWTVSYPMSFRLLYSEEGDLKFITHYHNPFTGTINVRRIWNLDNNTFSLDKTIGDIFD